MELPRQLQDAPGSRSKPRWTTYAYLMAGAAGFAVASFSGYAGVHNLEVQDNGACGGGTLYVHATQSCSGATLGLAWIGIVGLLVFPAMYAVSSASFAPSSKPGMAMAAAFFAGLGWHFIALVISPPDGHNETVSLVAGVALWAVALAAAVRLLKLFMPRSAAAGLGRPGALWAWLGLSIVGGLAGVVLGTILVRAIS
jgi:hypothetical protein